MQESDKFDIDLFIADAQLKFQISNVMKKYINLPYNEVLKKRIELDLRRIIKRFINKVIKNNGAWKVPNIIIDACKCKIGKYKIHVAIGHPAVCDCLQEE